MDSPQEELDFIPQVEICVHQIGTQLSIDSRPGDIWAMLTLTGHDDEGHDISVSGAFPVSVMDQLAIRLQEYQMAASMTGIHARVSPGVFRRLRNIILERRDERHYGHDH